MPDDECPHGLTTSTCSYCRPSPKTAAPKRTHGRASSQPSQLDSPASLERYRERYAGDREATFEAYVEVFFRLQAARNFPGGWTMFSRCANAEPALARGEPTLVARAEELMRTAGYVADDSGRPRRGRIWRRPRS